MYIIQTNTSLDNYNNPQDFQSMMFKYSSWDDYKKNLINRDFSSPIINGTMSGCIKPRVSRIVKIIIDDDKHFECIITNNYTTFNLKAYKVEEEQFRNLI